MRSLLKLSIAAAALSASVAANAELLYGVTLDNQLVQFDSATPNNITSGLALFGLGGFDVAGIDFRPSTGQLYVLSTGSQLFTANLTNGQLTSVGNLSTPLNGVTFGFDFNPTVDRIRIISGTDQNLNASPVDASVIVQGAITPAGSNIGGVAYTNNFQGATSTTLYGIEGQSNTLVTIVPGTGATTTVGSLGGNFTSLNGFDISGTSGVAYAGLQTLGTSGTTLYTVNLATGATSSLGVVGSGSTAAELRALTAAPAPVPEPASLAAIGIGLVALARRRKKA